MRALILDYGIMERMGAGTHPVGYPAMPPWVHPPVHPLVVYTADVTAGTGTGLKCAMGSKMTSNRAE